MEKNRFGKTSLQVTPLGFGAAEIGLLEISRDDVATLLNTVLDLGINVIDTAAGYRKSESLIGDLIADRRDEYVLVSKCGQGGSDDPDVWKPDALTESIDASLKQLRTDRLDVILLHSCSLEVLKDGQAVGALVKAQEAGKVRYVGYSGDDEAAAYAADAPELDVIETSVNICDQTNIDTVLPICRDTNTAVLAKRPIANAAWKDLDDQPGFYRDYAEPYTKRLQAMNISPQSLGYDGNWADLALRFTLSQPGVHTAIIGSTNPDHIRQNIDAANKPPLDDAMNSAIRKAFAEAEHQSCETWGGQT